MDGSCLLWIDLRETAPDTDFLNQLREHYRIHCITRTDDVDGAIQRYGPHCLCFDFDMPSRAELSLLQRSKAQHGSLPIVMFTAQHSEALAIWALRSRVWDYFVKPTAISDVCVALSPLIRNGRKDGAEYESAISPTASLYTCKQRTTRALDYIENEFSERITLEQAANLCHVSPWTFSRLFHREHGRTFRAYLLDYRIAKAKERLRNSNESISEIAYSVGFNDLSYFSRAFRRLTGMCPRDYRP